MMSWLHAIVFVFLTAIISSVLKRIFGPSADTVLGSSLILTISYGSVLCIGWFGTKRDRQEFFKKSPVEAPIVFLAIGLTFMLILLFLAIAEIEEVARGIDDNFVYGLGRFSFHHGFAALFVAPVMEELFFRDFLLSDLLKSNSKAFSVTVTTIIFLLFHLSTTPLVSDFLAMGVFGWFLCRLMIAYNNLWLCILLHFLWNLFNYVVPGLISMTRLPVDNVIVFWTFSLLIIGVCTMLSLKYLRRLNLLK